MEITVIYNKKRKVVVTGFRVLSSSGMEEDSNLDVLYGRKPLNLSRIDRYLIKNTSVSYGAEISATDISDIWEKKLRKYASFKDVAALSTIKKVWKDSGAEGVYDEKRSSLYIGVGSNQVGDLTPYFSSVLHCLDDGFNFNSSRLGKTLLDTISPMIVMEAILNNILCYGSKYLNFRGTNSNYMDYELSSFQAIKEATRSIEENRSDVAIVGGSNASLDPFNVMEDFHSGYYFDSKKYNCNSVDEVLEKLHGPYSTHPTGLLPVEGSAYLVLEEEQQAIKRGANILGTIRGIGSFAIGKKRLEDSLSRSMYEAVKESGIQKEDISFISGMGSSTRLDALELKAYDSFFSDKVFLYSLKGAFLNVVESFSAMALGFGFKILENKILPPSLRYKKDLNESSNYSHLLLSDTNQVLDKDLRFAMINTYSRNGASGSIVIEKT